MPATSYWRDHGNMIKMHTMMDGRTPTPCQPTTPPHINPKEHEELQRQVEELLAKGHIRETVIKGRPKNRKAIHKYLQKIFYHIGED
jgi:hypothetical protein